MAHQVDVAIPGRPYRVEIGSGTIAALPGLLAGLGRGRVALVASRRVLKLHRARLSTLVRDVEIAVPDGERHKNRRTLDRVHDALLTGGIGRDGVVVAVGGGVVGDLAGFAAATYMRGIDLVQVPTTLLAMVDSSIGGKVGVDHPRAKNLIGAFHQPRGVVADLDFLDTLPPRQFRAGAHEMLKCGVIGDPALFALLERGLPLPDQASLAAAIAAACSLKARIVEADEREGGLRRVLNLGHTLGHALESETGYRRFLHGEAVGWGTIAAARLACRRGLLAPSEARRIEAAVDGLGRRPDLGGLDTDAVLAAAFRDKKVRAGRLVFVLPRSIGRVEVVEDVEPAEVRAVLSELLLG